MINSTKQNATLNNDKIKEHRAHHSTFNSDQIKENKLNNDKIKTLQMAQISVSNINNEYANRWQC
jgi:hypothetical protein